MGGLMYWLIIIKIPSMWEVKTLFLISISKSFFKKNIDSNGLLKLNNCSLSKNHTPLIWTLGDLDRTLGPSRIVLFFYLSVDFSWSISFPFDWSENLTHFPFLFFFLFFFLFPPAAYSCFASVAAAALSAASFSAACASASACYLAASASAAARAAASASSASFAAFSAASFCLASASSASNLSCSAFASASCLSRSASSASYRSRSAFSAASWARRSDSAAYRAFSSASL